jgi:hypothetical protein
MSEDNQVNHIARLLRMQQRLVNGLRRAGINMQEYDLWLTDHGPGRPASPIATRRGLGWPTGRDLEGPVMSEQTSF